MKTVLYINGKLGIWMCFERGMCINMHVESLRVEQPAYQPCGWLESKRQFVHLVIDSEHAEIDAYPLQPKGPAMHQLSHKKALRKTLIDRFPDAIIRTPEKSTGLDALLVQKLNLSQLTRQWLVYVEQSNITVCSVTTSAETAASLFEIHDRPYLAVCNVPGYCTHTFCASGHALFTRTLEKTEGISIIGGLEETLSHLRTTELVDSPVRVCLLGLTVKQLNAASSLEWVDELVQCDEPNSQAIGEYHKPGEDAEQYGAVIHIAQHMLSQRALRQHGWKRYVSLALTKHLNLIKHRNSRVHLAALSVLTVCVAGYNGSKMLDVQYKYSDYVQAKAALSLAIDNTRQAVLDESPVGIDLSDALFDVEALKASAGPGLANLLPMLATVFTKHRELVLQEVSWVAIDNASADNNDIEKFRVEYAVVERVTARNHISTEHISVSNLLVNVIGNSDATATLREQQSALDAVVSMLNQYSSISHLTVLEAPLANAANDDLIGADGLDLATSFRIQFQVARRAPNDA